MNRDCASAREGIEMTFRSSWTSVRWLQRGISVLTLAAALALFGPRDSLAAELVMFETMGCSWCAVWNDEVGGIYHKTPEAKTAPLRRVDLDEARPPDLESVRGIVYTPTFVLVDQGRELGRISGYPGADHFWGLLGMLLDELGPGLKS